MTMVDVNAVPKQPAYDKKDQLDRIVPYIIPGENLMAVYDCKGLGTGFVGVTDRRVIFFDQGMIMNKNKKMISIPFNQIIGVASGDEGIFFKSSEFTLLTAAGNFQFEFRGADKALWVYRYIMSRILTHYITATQ